MNRLSAGMLTDDELMHYGALDAVQGPLPNVIARLEDIIISTTEDYDAEADEKLEEEINVLERRLVSLTEGLTLVFTKFPNLKEGDVELYDTYRNNGAF